MNASSRLEALLTEALENNWCVRIKCTTCGSTQFRRKLKSLLQIHSQSTSGGSGLGFDSEQALELVSELSKLEPSNDLQHHNWRDPVMLLLYLCWNAIGELRARTEMPDRLADTYAGEELNRMIRHHDEVTARRLAYLRSQSPEYVEKNRAAKKAERQRRHQERLERKKLRDAKYWEAKRTDST